MTFQTVACAACLMMCIITIFNTSEAEAIKEGARKRKAKGNCFCIVDVPWRILVQQAFCDGVMLKHMIQQDTTTVKCTMLTGELEQHGKVNGV